MNVLKSLIRTWFLFPSSPINNKAKCFSSQHFFDTEIRCFSFFSQPKTVMPIELYFSILHTSLTLTENFMYLKSSFLVKSLSAFAILLGLWSAGCI